MASWQDLFGEDVRAWKRLGYLGDARRSTPARLSETLRLLQRYVPVRATLVYRLSHAAERAHIPGLPMFLMRYNQKHHALDIVPGVEIGGGLYMPHVAGTVIMATRIGRNCSIIHGATIGMRNEVAFPVIGDDVTIGAGARVLGGITLGDGAQVGANAVVITDVPAGYTAVGIPARLIPPRRAPRRSDVSAEAAALRE